MKRRLAHWGTLHRWGGEGGALRLPSPTGGNPPRGARLEPTTGAQEPTGWDLPEISAHGLRCGDLTESTRRGVPLAEAM